MKLSSLRLFAAFGLLAAAAEPAAAARFTGSCNVDKMKYVIVDTTASTTSNALVPVPGSSINFTQTVAGCVEVEFTASATAQGTNSMSVQAYIDGQYFGGTAPVWFFTRGDVGQAVHSMTAIFTDVQPGLHNIQINYASDDGDPVFINQRHLVVRYH